MVVQGTVRVELYDSRKNTLIPAHESDLAQIALNLDGTRYYQHTQTLLSSVRVAGDPTQSAWALVCVM
jgi:hypothetical protein